MNYQLRLGLILACFLFLFACQKEDILENSPTVEDRITLESIIGSDPLLDKFFNGIAEHDTEVNSSNLATVDKVKLAMAKDHQDTPFVGDYIRKVGFPLWGQAKLSQQSNGVQFYALPFAKPSSVKTTAVLYIFVNQQNFIYELALRSDITDYIDAYENETNTFYWENLLSFVIDHILFDEQIFDTKDSDLLDWYYSNKDTYLTSAADTREEECWTATRQDCIAKPIALQERGQERACPEGYEEVFIIIEVCAEFDDEGNIISINTPHNPGGQTDGVPNLGGNKGGTNTAPDPGGNPPFDPGTWGDEGNNSTTITNLQAAVLQNFLDQLEEENQLDWFNLPAQEVLRNNIISRILGTPPDLNSIPVAHDLIDIMEENDLDFDEDNINLLLNNPQILSDLIDFVEDSEDGYDEIIIVDGYIMGVDEDGILHIDLEKLDINNVKVLYTFKFYFPEHRFPNWDMR